MNKLVLWLLLITSLLGCSLSRYVPSFSYTRVTYHTDAVKIVPIWIDKNFGEADKIEIDKGIVRWNYALNGFIKLEIADSHFDMDVEVIKRVRELGGWIILKVDSTNPMLNRLANPDRTLAWADRIGGNYIFIVRDKIFDAWVTGIAMHEMGHLLGAGHVGEYLMRAGFQWELSRCVDLASLEVVAKYQHLPIKRLNYCVYSL